MRPPTTRIASTSHHHPLPALLASDEVPDVGEGDGEAGVTSVCVGATDVGPGAVEVAGAADVGCVVGAAVGPVVGRVVGAAVGRVLAGVVGAAVGALVACVGCDGLLVGAIVLVGARDRDGSREAVIDGRAAEPLALAPQPDTRASADSASRQTNAFRLRERRS